MSAFWVKKYLAFFVYFEFILSLWMSSREKGERRRHEMENGSRYTRRDKILMR